MSGGDILFLAHRIPYPPDRGDKIRSWNMLRHLGTLGRVHLGCFADDAADAAHLGALRAAMGGSLGEAYVEVRHENSLSAVAKAMVHGKPVSLGLFESPDMRAFATGMTDKVDAVFAFSSQMAQFVPQSTRQRFVMDFVDMDSAKFGDYARGFGPRAWLCRREAAKLFAFERATAARADISLFVSEAEARLFRGKAGLPDADIRAVGNGVDLRHFDPAADFVPLGGGVEPLVVFTGQMDYRPNVEAVCVFAEHSLPLVRAGQPDARFAIVGRNPARPVRRLAKRAGVRMIGAVPDMRPWLAAADIVVAPLGIARGVQNKVLEAMAMARPVVASHAAFEGIDAEPGRDLIVADEPAEAILALLADPQRAKVMGQAARRQMERAYRWDIRLAPLAGLIGIEQREAAE